eukprot:TCONS_00002099-protein
MPLSTFYRNPYSNSSAPALQQNPHSYSIREPLVSKLEMHLSCANLKDRDYLSKSDPMVVIFVEVPKGDKRIWKEYDRTESVRDDLNPTFVKSIIIEYYFEVYQRMKFEVYDRDSSSAVLNNHDFLGYVEVSLGSIVGEHGGTTTKNLYSRQKEKLRSTITFNVEELFDTKEILKLQIKGHRLDQKDLFSSSDPFIVISRCSLENNNFLPVYKTEMIKNNNSPIWKKFEIPVTTLCNGDRDRVIRFECFDSGSKRTLIGSCDTSLNELLRDPKQKLVLTQKKSKAHAGSLRLQFIEIESKASFLDYIAAGLQLCFHVAIDFTASNGNVALPSSLHYPHGTNQYMEALWNVGRICEDYDTDKLITAYGFGAKVNKQIAHDFHLNFKRDPHCNGILGVLQAYQNAIKYVEFFGPTNFAPIINKIADLAEKQATFDKYHVVLILTDGMISDIGLTKKALIRASRLPISVIIVGVGSGNFDSMVELDSDDKLLIFQDQTADRDIVQFVAYENFSGCFAAVDLAQEVLYEVPYQLTSYMEKHRIDPKHGLTPRETPPSSPLDNVEMKLGDVSSTSEVSLPAALKENTEQKEKPKRKFSRSHKRKESKVDAPKIENKELPFAKKEMTAKDFAMSFLKENKERQRKKSEAREAAAAAERKRSVIVAQNQHMCNCSSKKHLDRI